MDYSYLGIYPSQRIVRQINADDPDLKSGEKLTAEALAYIKVLKDENLQHLKMRKGSTIDNMETYKFLRSQERIQNTELIIQYLCSFYNHLPLEEDIKGNPANPFEQLKTFIRFSVNILKDKDVSTAILREHERLGLLTDTNRWYYSGQIDKSFKVLYEMIQSAKSATIEGYCKLFQAQQQLCIFWFSVRNEDIKRVRKSDIYIYKLTRYLLEKHQIDLTQKPT